MKPNWYTLIRRALEEGAEFGWARAHKHTNDPDQDAVMEKIIENQMSALSEVIEWDKEE